MVHRKMSMGWNEIGWVSLGVIKGLKSLKTVKTPFNMFCIVLKKRQALWLFCFFKLLIEDDSDDAGYDDDDDYDDDDNDDDYDDDRNLFGSN